MSNEFNDYNDIINIPYKKSEKFPHMSIRDRAAQFAPFSALTGYSDTVSEAGRITDRAIQLDEYEIVAIDKKLQAIAENIDGEPCVKITYFIPDQSKAGGKYRTISGVVGFVDDFEKKLIFSGGEAVSFDSIVSLNIETE